MALPRTGPAKLERASSRTRTAHHPLARPQVIQLSPVPTLAFSTLHAGAPIWPATVPGLDGELDGLTPPESALQVLAVSNDYGLEEGLLALLLDFEVPVEIARIELYGNLMLPPSEDEGRPQHNFGLPGSLSIAVREGVEETVDKHGRPVPGDWTGSAAMGPWHPRFEQRDLRGLWGWTPIVLPPTFGRQILIVMRDLPIIADPVTGQARRGVDIQRLVVYPFQEDVDHRPHVEFAPVASWQDEFAQDSQFWASHGQTDPAPMSHQSAYREPVRGQVLLPSALAGLNHSPSGNPPVQFYSSDPVPKDQPDARVRLVVQATTDEIPLLHGVELTLGDLPFKGRSTLPNYRVAVDVTNDSEAAHSPASEHPGWRRAHAPTLVSNAPFDTPVTRALTFQHPEHARWVRLVVEIVDVPNLHWFDRRFQLAGLALLRSRDFALIPEEDEDIRVESVVLRLRGARLMDDYAYVDGLHGMGLTLHHRPVDGAAEELQRFRTLLELLENAQTRVFANQRVQDLRHQRHEEHVETMHKAERTSDTQSSSEQTLIVTPQDTDRQVSISGTVTMLSDDPKHALDDTVFDGLPDGPLGDVRTERRFPPMNPDEVAHLMEGQSLLGSIGPWLHGVAGGGQPGSISIGLSTSRSGGGSGGVLGIGMSGSDSFGGSLSASFQVGGGIAFSRVEGRQGNITTTETRILESHRSQSTESSGRSRAVEQSEASDERMIERWDRTPVARRSTLNVSYGGETEDIVLIVLPVNLVLRGRSKAPAVGLDRPSAGDAQPLPRGDELRLQIDHLPPGVSLDCEFRGTIFPIQAQS